MQRFIRTKHTLHRANRRVGSEKSDYNRKRFTGAVTAHARDRQAEQSGSCVFRTACSPSQTLAQLFSQNNDANQNQVNKDGINFNMIGLDFFLA